MTEVRIRFLVDDHLRRLARWLCSAGLDAEWEEAIADRELYRRSWVEKRTILTMDRSLWAPRLYQVKSRKIGEQFRAVVTEFSIDPYEDAFTRCVLCNVLHQCVPKEEVADDVPPKAYARYDQYRRCPSCRRVFWRGGHTRWTLEFFENATGKNRPARFDPPVSRPDGN